MSKSNSFKNRFPHAGLFLVIAMVLAIPLTVFSLQNVSTNTEQHAATSFYPTSYYCTYGGATALSYKNLATGTPTDGTYLNFYHSPTCITTSADIGKTVLVQPCNYVYYSGKGLTGNIAGYNQCTPVVVTANTVPDPITNCTPTDSCATHKYTCGNFTNSCGASINCGTCGSGLTCSNNTSCVNNTVQLPAKTAHVDISAINQSNSYTSVPFGSSFTIYDPNGLVIKTIAGNGVNNGWSGNYPVSSKPYTLSVSAPGYVVNFGITNPSSMTPVIVTNNSSIQTVVNYSFYVSGSTGLVIKYTIPCQSKGGSCTTTTLCRSNRGTLINGWCSSGQVCCKF